MTKPATRVFGEPLDSALRSLDVTADGSSRTAEVPAPPRSRSLAPLLVGAAAAALLVGGVILIPPSRSPAPSVGSTPVTTASASETLSSESTPGELTPAEIAAVAKACKAEFARGSKEPSPDLAVSRIVATERRGDEVLVLYAWPSNSGGEQRTSVVYCLATLPTHSETPTWVAHGVLGAEAVTGRAFNVSLSRGPGMGGTFATLSGPVGDDIAAVTVHEDGLDTPAVVAQGIVYAWWRSPMPTEKLSVPPGSTAAHGTVTITYTDGSTDTRPWFDVPPTTTPHEPTGG